MQTYGYHFYFKDGSNVLTFPITPGELNITVGSNNKVVTLINEGDINILKSPALVEVSFDARFPMRKYPYSRTPYSFQTYFDKFKELKENRKSFRFIVARTTESGKPTWDTNLLVALESIDLKESADQGDDVIISFKLKQYKEYGIQRIILNNSSSNSTSNTTSNVTSNTTSTAEKENNRSNDNEPAQDNKTYTVQNGDTLWAIAKKHYGDGSKYTLIYTKNATVIENAAKAHGFSSSSNGSRIWTGTKLIIPPVG